MKSREPTTTDPTGQARPLDRQNVTESAEADELAGRHAERDRGVEQAGAVDVQRHPALVGDGGDRGGVRRVQRLAHRVGVGVLEHHEGRDGLVDVVRSRNASRIVRGVHRAVGAGPQLPHRRADHDRMSGLLVDDDVGARVRDDLAAPRHVRHRLTRLPIVPLATNRPASLPSSSAARVLERDDRRVVLEHVVAHLGSGHRPAHRRATAG